MVSWVRAYVIAVVVAAVLGAIVSSTFVLNGLASIMGPIPLSDRAASGLKDLRDFAPTYAAALAVPYAVMLGLGGFVARRVRGVRVPVLAIAASGASVGVVLGLAAAIGNPVIAGARDPAGIAAQAACGAIAGLIFALAHRPRPLMA
ncbi:MAG: hypothetical protein ACOYM8_01075 [Caulobacterales bacterium]